MKQYRKHLLMCASSDCSELGAEVVHDALKEFLRQKGLAREVLLTKTGCLKECEHGPILIVYPDGVWYSRVGVGDLDEIIDEHLIGGQIVSRLLYSSLDFSGGK